MRVNSIIKQMNETNLNSNCRNRGIPSWNKEMKESKPIIQMPNVKEDLSIIPETFQNFRDKMYSALNLDMDTEDQEENPEEI